jgi:hypothetical protein
VGSIEHELDLALVLAKRRAAQFDNRGVLPMTEWLARDGWRVCQRDLLTRAVKNLERARDALCEEGDFDPADVLDCLNLVALSVTLPRESQP